jgi:GTP-binding protein HflX
VSKDSYRTESDTKPHAILIRALDQVPNREDFVLPPEESLQELARLAETVDLVPCATLLQVRDYTDPATYLGKGKVEELASLIARHDASLVISDTPLTSSQVRNLEDILGVSVIDRTELILRIFASRAISREGKLQVELAARRHELTRLTGHGIEMSNPGAGLRTRGPGEQRIEQDRRVLRERISRLNRELKRLHRIRSEQNKLRKNSKIPLVSLVGYTNAGKSTLFNRLSGDKALADDKLFATLDPWIRKWTLSSGETVLCCDTVGFIQGLPHELVASFRSTLEDSVNADIILHVVDSSSPSWEHQMDTVNKVLRDLEVSDRPTICVFNKIDKTETMIDLDFMSVGQESSVFISALSGEGIADLEQAVINKLRQSRVRISFHIPYTKWDVYNELKQSALIVTEEITDKGATLICEVPKEIIGRIQHRLEA